MVQDFLRKLHVGGSSGVYRGNGAYRWIFESLRFEPFKHAASSGKCLRQGLSSLGEDKYDQVDPDLG